MEWVWRCPVHTFAPEWLAFDSASSADATQSAPDFDKWVVKENEWKWKMFPRDKRANWNGMSSPRH